MADDFLDSEKTKAMENLLARYTLSTDFVKINLGQITESSQEESRSPAKAQVSQAEIENAETSEEEVNSGYSDRHCVVYHFQIVPQAVPLGYFSYCLKVYTGEISHQKFTSRLQRKINEDLQGSKFEV